MSKLPQELDERQLEQAKKRLDWAVGFLTIKYSFVYQVLGLLHKEKAPGISTMGVRVQSGQMYLGYDPRFVLTIKSSCLTFALYHEVLHLVLLHCTCRRFANKELGNIAADLAVNELVPITPGSCEPEIGKDGKRTWYFVDDLRKIPKFKDIKNMQSAEWYYNFLMERTQAGNGGQSGIPGKAGDDHAGWNPDDTIANERVKAHVDYIDKNDLWGDVSASDQEVIKAAQTRPINWQAILKMLIGAFAWHERESTRKRINRRTGFIHPGYRKLKVDRVLVVVDTSGSTFMYNLLGRFLSLINSMTDTCPIDLMQCDCRITEEPQPFEQYQNEFTFKGNGGTSFDPIIKLVDERGYRMVVILTDGQASVCPEPQSARVVWVTPQGMKPPVDWGIRVEMESYD